MPAFLTPGAALDFNDDLSLDRAEVTLKSSTWDEHVVFNQFNLGKQVLPVIVEL